ncbi:HEK2 [Sanghuangporus weigelae]
MADGTLASPLLPLDVSLIAPYFFRPHPPVAGSVGDQSGAASASAQEILTLRALVSTKDAGVIIGKGGKNVADLREETGVKAGVSKVVPGVHERVLTVSGDVESVAKAYRLIISQLIEANPPSPTGPSPSSNTSIRLLISHNLMGTIIGRGGLKIKAIQDASGARMVASKDMLPQSTERIVEVQGSADSIGSAIEQIGKSLLEDWERGQGTVLYHPGPSVDGASAGRRSSNGFPSGSFSGTRRANANGDRVRGGSPPPTPPQSLPPSSPQQTANLRTQNIAIPSDMVGCIIGRGGTKITEIRRLSGCKISIAKTPHDETGERMFTIVGTPEANEKALFLLYNQLESEKERRVGREAQQKETI